jgi:hypothetical protein
MSISTTSEVTSETKDTSDNNDRDRDEHKELLNNKQLMEVLGFFCAEKANHSMMRFNRWLSR